MAQEKSVPQEKSGEKKSAAKRRGKDLRRINLRIAIIGAFDGKGEMISLKILDLAALAIQKGVNWRRKLCDRVRMAKKLFGFCNRGVVIDRTRG